MFAELFLTNMIGVFCIIIGAKRMSCAESFSLYVVLFIIVTSLFLTSVGTRDAMVALSFDAPASS